jgi:hypothetical protein
MGVDLRIPGQGTQSASKPWGLDAPRRFSKLKVSGDVLWKV